ncbi:Uncharacterized protein LAWI1_G006326 [Lachnellula willkommii]|uniref:2-dehydropantoate 2-reductase n=1 Tax=Lachnellula willkommii TaxID=215461 RepID=A0A559M2F4_9HELO|nr:Uncharacterized protein LAWI1_G006326 [Lachnellula willkommii]
MESTEKKANVLLFGGGAVGAIAALNIESGGLGSVTAVLRSNFKVVEEEGYKIESVDHGNFKGWRPTKVVNSVPDVEKECLPPFNYIVTSTKNCPDIPPSLVSLIAPGSAVEGLVRPAMKEVFETAKLPGHELDEGIMDTMINCDPMDLYLKPSMQVDWEKGNHIEFEYLVGEPLREAEKIGVPTPNLRVIYEIFKGLQWRRRRPEDW